MKLDILKSLNEERRARRAAVLVTDLSSGAQRLVKAAEIAADPMAEAIDKQLRMGKSASVEFEGKTYFLTVQAPPARLVVNRFPQPIPPGAIEQARALQTEAGSQLVELLEAREAARSEALITLGGASSLGVQLRPLLLPQAGFDPNAVQVADWLVSQEAA